MLKLTERKDYYVFDNGLLRLLCRFSDFEEGFKKTVSRGPDDSRIIDTGKGLLGFHRLAIMGLTPDGMQPFELDGSYVVCNGEIYGYEKIKEELAKNTHLKAAPTARYFSRSTVNTAWICSRCSTPSLR